METSINGIDWQPIAGSATDTQFPLKALTIRFPAFALPHDNCSEDVTLCLDIFKNSEIEPLDELRENLIRAKPRRVIIDSRRDD
jgi:hypothetical protein